ncbi:hypothetical protein, partial [Paenibacillus agaridevorans]|uniref:hypothetical protein n=1 Tax=Paenibacillus agaridevorans TaxID=171404 RepID=UPI002159E9E4
MNESEYIIATSVDKPLRDVGKIRSIGNSNSAACRLRYLCPNILRPIRSIPVSGAGNGLTSTFDAQLSDISERMRLDRRFRDTEPTGNLPVNMRSVYSPASMSFSSSSGSTYTPSLNA